MTQKNSSGILFTQDKVKISFEHFKNNSDSLVIVCPGFFNSKKDRWIRKAIDMISTSYDVIAFDFRGHGESSGKFTWMAKEGLDLKAVMDYAIGQRYNNIGILAFSMGAAISLVFASRRRDLKSMVLISCPSSFWDINFHFWEPEMFSDLRANFECNWEGKGARIDHLFLPKGKPVECIPNVKETAIFFIHGDKDWVIKDYHSRILYDALTAKRKKLEVISNGLHAERLIEQYPDRMKELILNWFSQTL